MQSVRKALGSASINVDEQKGKKAGAPLTKNLSIPANRSTRVKSTYTSTLFDDGRYPSRSGLSHAARRPRQLWGLHRVDIRI